MATGREHESFTLTLSPVIGTAVFMATNDVTLGVCAAWGCYMGIYLSPDLDVREITRPERIVMNRYRIVGRLWWLYWLPYGYVIPHRHPISHWPVLGTVIRVVYLLAVPFFIVLLLGIVWADIPRYFLEMVSSFYFVAAVVGLMVADFGHWLKDYVV